MRQAYQHFSTLRPSACAFSVHRPAASLSARRLAPLGGSSAFCRSGLARLRSTNRFPRLSGLTIPVAARDDFLKAQPGEAGRSVLKC